MRIGHYNNSDLEGFATIRDWLINAIDTALLVAPDRTRLVFITPLTNSRYTMGDRDSLELFKKKVAKCTGLGVGATRNAMKRRGK
jgi:hypothetical protein